MILLALVCAYTAQSLMTRTTPKEISIKKSVAFWRHRAFSFCDRSPANAKASVVYDEDQIRPSCLKSPLSSRFLADLITIYI